MTADHVTRAVALSILAAVALSAQTAREHDPVPLKNWPAPLYWQPGAELAPQAATIGSIQPAAAPALVFVALSPCRVADTRQGQGFSGNFGPPSLAAGQTRTFPIQSSTNCTIPAIAKAYSFNVTVVPIGSLLYLTVFPATAGVQPAPPNASTLNAPLGNIVANAAIVPAGTDGAGGVDVYASNPTDLIIDINGYYAATADLNGNTWLGTGALGANTTGYDNTATGTSALSSNTTGANNSATGSSALAGNTTGTQNTANGANALQFNTIGGSNTAVGASALFANTIGADNTATGAGALLDNTTGNGNTGVGQFALGSNTTGSFNSAFGSSALSSNTIGTGSAAFGQVALQSNTTGAGNSAFGTVSLTANTTGSFNTGLGYGTLQANTTANANTAVGQVALQNNTTGSGNSGLGANALNANTSGGLNTAVGQNALAANTTGSFNTAVGQGALTAATGSSNTAIGAGAGRNIGNGANNLDIANSGSSGDNLTIRIGNSLQNAFFASGIRGTTTGNNDAIAVVIDSNGQLGTVSSSARFKEDIHEMGEASAGLLQLRPVTFRYRQPFDDGSKPIQYGLIAEEVAKVYPDLVAHSANGQIESVKYQVLDAMLLNELQKATEKIRSLEERLAALENARQ